MTLWSLGLGRSGRNQFVTIISPIAQCLQPPEVHSQNLKEVPQNFTEVFNVDDVAPIDVMQRNQHRKEKKQT